MANEKMDDLISRLSELRCQYNCFDENERDAYHTLSEAIKALSDVPDTNVGDTISRQAAIDAVGSMLRRKFGIGGNLAEITLEDLPSVDAVDVVRCKNCKWYRTTLVGLACDKHLMPFRTDDDDFCSFAERKTDGSD